MTKEEAKKIKINDIVICNTSFQHLPQKGWKGKVVSKNKSEMILGVEWEEYFKFGHSCDSKGEIFKCRYYSIQNRMNINCDISILDLFNKQLEFKF